MFHVSHKQRGQCDGVECGGGGSGLGSDLQALAVLCLSPQELPRAHRLPGDWKGQQSPESKKRFLKPSGPAATPSPSRDPALPVLTPPRLAPLQLPFTLFSVPFDPRATQPMSEVYLVCILSKRA